MQHVVSMFMSLHFDWQYLLFACLFLIVLAYMGLGLSLLFTPRALKRYTLFLTPLVGYCYLTLIGWYCYSAGLRGTDKYASYLLIPPLLFLYLGYLRHRRKYAKCHSLWKTSDVAPVVIALAGFMLVSIPYFRNVNGLTSITINNDDIADSATVSTYLKEYGRTEATGFLGQSDIFRVLAETSIFGASYSTAFAASLFGKQTYQLQSLSVNLFFTLGLLLVYALARDSFRYGHYGALLVTAVVAMDPVLAFTAYNGYQGQVFAAALALALLVFHICLIRHARRFSDGYAYFPLVVLFNWGLSLTYPHMLPFVYTPLGAYALLLWVRSKQVARLKAWFLFALAALGGMAILSPYRAAAVILHTLLTAHETEGWFIPWHFSVFALQNGNVYVDAGLSIVLATVITFGLWKESRRNQSVWLLSIASLFTIVSGFVILSYVGRSEAHTWGGYKSYKLLSFFLPLVVASSLIMARNIGRTRIRRLGIMASMALLVLGSGYAVREMTWTVASVNSNLAGLRQLDPNAKVESINILGKRWWNILWETDFLLGKRLYFQTSTYAGRQASALEGGWDLVNVNVDEKARRGAIPNCILSVNSSYILIRASKSCRTLE